MYKDFRDGFINSFVSTLKSPRAWLASASTGIIVSLAVSLYQENEKEDLGTNVEGGTSVELATNTHEADENVMVIDAIHCDEIGPRSFALGRFLSEGETVRIGRTHVTIEKEGYKVEREPSTNNYKTERLKITQGSSEHPETTTFLRETLSAGNPEEVKVSFRAECR